MLACYEGYLGVFAITVVVIVATKKLLKWTKHKSNADRLRRRVAAKRRKERDYISSQLKDLSQQLNKDQTDAILELSTPELLQKLRNKSLKSKDVVNAYVHKACKATATTNCVTEVIRGCDEAAESMENESLEDCPLYGLPVSLKESMNTKGSFGTLGLACFLDKSDVDDCVLAKVLKHCGAVPFVKTNLPQTTITFESSNPIYGQTTNPHNPNFIPGGSSSGEGALIGAGASPLGFGTDTGGSIRTPAHMCGICGLKPTANRISTEGITPPYALTSVATSAGPMARDVETLVIAMRALLCDLMFKLDPNVVPLKFRDEMYTSKKPMRIGYYDDDGYTKPFPACQRAVHIAKEALEKAGHTLVPFKVPDIARAMENFGKVLFADGGRSSMELLEDDEVDECIQGVHRIWQMPWIARKLYAMMKGFQSPRVGAAIMATGGGHDQSAYYLWKARGEIEQYKTMFWAEWRDKYNIEAMIAPAYPLVACPLGSVRNTLGVLNYTGLYNLVSGPAGVVPVTKVTQGDIDKLATYKGHYGDEWDEHIKTACVDSINMPVTVQCISLPWHDEVCLRLMKEVETLVGTK